MEYTCKDFKVGKCEGEKMVDGETLPLVLQPSDLNKKDMKTLLLSLENNKEWFEKMLIKNSAVLIRGFDVENAVEFNDIVETFGWEDIRYVGPAPRTHIHKRIWTANEGPLSEFIYYHHEMVLVSSQDHLLSSLIKSNITFNLSLRQSLFADQGISEEIDVVL